jgi:hypothetical protein
MIKSSKEWDMSASDLFRSALALSSLSLFAACVAEEPSSGPSTAPAAGTHTAGVAGAGDASHSLAVTGGRIRLTVKQPHAVAGSSEISPVSLAIDLETVAAWRGNTALDVTAVGGQLPAPDGVTTVRVDFTETVEDSLDGVEQSWRFERAPGQAGDLVIAVGTAGLDYVGSDGSGLHLRRAGELDVSYSHGTWIDAGGHAWEVPARYDGGRILLTVPASVVAGSTFPAVLDPKIVVTPIL